MSVKTNVTVPPGRVLIGAYATAMNRLAQETSPYLLQHADNPVDWWPWGDEAFAEARRRDVPILLSVGYAACHWCHVMDRESYDDPEVAKIVNENFVAVKVDRDERPDIDSRYQAAVGALTGQGGWPLTAFLTPDGKPFYGGTYFPPEDQYGRPSFKRVLLSISKAFRVPYREGHQLLFRTEMFNATNHSNFRAANLNRSAGGFGQVRATFPARQVQFGLRLAF
jgi:uncharacterized protein YyaL (SSP411 family)